MRIVGGSINVLRVLAEIEAAKDRVDILRYTKYYDVSK